MNKIIQMHHHEAMQLKIPEIELLLCRRDEIFHWSVRRQAASTGYWRLFKAYNEYGRIYPHGEEIVMHTNEIYLISPGTEFEYHSVGGVVDKLYILFMIKGYYSNINDQVFCLKNNRRLLGIADRISNRLLSGDNGSDDLALEANALVSLALTGIKKSELDIDQEHEFSLVRVLHHIIRNPIENIEIGELARMAQMSPGVFCEKFRSAFGITPRQCYIEHRIKRAETLLQQTDLSISEIADQCGFCDRYYFTRAFSKSRGIAPAAFRRQFRSFDVKN